MSFAYSYHKVVTYKPQSMHSWRQADCTSIAHGYIKENNLLEPQIHNLISDDLSTGKTAGEFPGLYYVVGKLWQLFGHHEWIYRLLVLCLFLASVFCLFRALTKHLDQFWAIVLSLTIFTSPLVVFYANNFLSNVPALSFAIFGLAVYFDYREKPSSRKWLFICLLFMISGLLKVTGLIGFIGICGAELVMVLSKRRKVNWLPFFGGGLLTLFFVFLWYSYAGHYNELHGGKYTFNDFWPIWQMSAEDIIAGCKFFGKITFFQLFSPLGYLLIFFFGGYFLVRLRSIPIDLKIVTLITGIGAALYVLCWFNALEYHDYYFLNPMIFPVILAVSAMYGMKSRELFQKYWIRVSALVILFGGVIYCHNNMRMRYSDQLGVYNMLAWKITTKNERAYWSWVSNDNYLDAFMEIEPYLDEIGVEKDALVVSFPDPSFNISLYLMNRKGWTAYGGNMSDSRSLQQKIDHGASYILTADNSTLDVSAVEHLIGEEIGRFRNVKIFRVKQ